MDVVTGIVTGALGGQGLTQIATNAAAPYVANAISNTFGDNAEYPNKAAQLLSHAVLGAVVAYNNGGSAAAGAVSGAGSELAGDYLLKTLYPGKEKQDLNEQEKQQLKGLTNSVAAVAGGITGNSAANVAISTVVADNAVEHNLLLTPKVKEKLSDEAKLVLDKLINVKLEKWDDLDKEFKGCNGSIGCKQSIRERYDQASVEQKNYIIDKLAKGEITKAEFDVVVNEIALANADYVHNTSHTFLGTIETESWHDGRLLNEESGAHIDNLMKEGYLAANIKEWYDQGLTELEIDQKLSNFERDRKIVEIASLTAGGFIAGSKKNIKGNSATKKYLTNIKDKVKSSIKANTPAKPKPDAPEVSHNNTKALDVAAYKDLKSKAKVGDNLEHDHVPSFAAVKLAKEKELGRKLFPKEEKELYNNATAIELPKDLHQAGRTYAGKNTVSQVTKDAQDLCKAQHCDLDVIKNNLLQKGKYDSKSIDEALKKVMELNKNKGIK